MKKSAFIFFIVAAFVLVQGCRIFSSPPKGGAAPSPASASPAPTPVPYPDPVPGSAKLPVGMNVGGLSYWDPGPAFTDAMTTASDMFTSNADETAFDTGMIGEIPRDENGYPTELPRTTSDGRTTFARFMVNDYYSGRYRIFFDGNGTLGGLAYQEGGAWYIDLDGRGENHWIDIRSSDPADRLRNIRILPEAYASGTGYPAFRSEYLAGLRPFHALRFMDWTNTNGSVQREWADRATPAYYSQSSESRGTSLEYAVELCNELDEDAWVCVPHQASDDYILRMARFLYDRLEPGLKVYLEFSNEMWNWGFSQSTYLDENAPGHPNPYVSADLSALAGYPEKDAYMMARAFRIWEGVFGAGSPRLVKVGTGQTAWAGNSDRILGYLESVDRQCDVFSGAGYFGYTEEAPYPLHQSWLASAPSSAKVIEDILALNEASAVGWIRDTGALARRYGVGYVAYEGGQHIAALRQEEWSYNQAFYDAQIDQRIYYLYKRIFEVHKESGVDCRLFMAYSYVSQRESRYGSWGHLESLSQIGGDYWSIAPKYKALLDYNSPK